MTSPNKKNLNRSSNILSTEDRVTTKDMRKLENKGMGNYMLGKYEWKESQNSNLNMKQNIIKGKKKALHIKEID